MSENFEVVDRVSRDTAQHLEATDATLAYHEDDVFVLEERDDGGEA